MVDRLRRVKTLGFYLIVLIGGPLLLLVVLEGFTRLAAPDDLTLRITEPAIVTDADATGFYRNTPNFEGKVWNVSVETNADGFRGPQHAAGEQSVVLLGDSILFGIGLTEDDAPTTQLTSLLYPNVRIVNTAAIGYGTAHQRTLLEREGDWLAPSVLVLGYCLNDPLPMKTSSIAQPSALSALQRANVWLRKRILLFLWLKDQLGTYRVQHGYEPLRALFNEPSWSTHRADLDAIATWSTARSVPLVVAVFPHRDQLIASQPTDDVPQQLLAEWAEASGVVLVDLRAFLSPEDYLAADPYHMDARGMQKALAALVPHIQAALHTSAAQISS